MQADTTLPPGQAPFVTVYNITLNARARNAANAASRIQQQIDGIGHQHPRPYRKPMVSGSRDGTILLAIENVHFSQHEADANSLQWARQIARQAGLSDQEYDIKVFESRQLAPHRQP